MRYIFVAAFFSFLLAGSLFFWHDKFQVPLMPKPSLGETKLGLGNAITLLFAGDIMLDRGVEFYITQHNDWKFPFLRIADTLRKADLAFGNLESVISDKGQNLGSIYSFQADPKALEGLTFAGFDVLSVANNHSMDYGMEAFLDSLQLLKKTGVSYVGGGTNIENAHSLVIKEIKGAKIGFLGYTNLGSSLWQATDKTPGIAWVDENTVFEFQKNIAAAKEQSDILIVSVHFGEEYQTEPNEIQKLIAKSAIDAGANIVIGHHPHVIQPVEYVCNQVTHICGWVAWSLGNFVFDQGFSPKTMEGLLLEVIIQDKKITRVTPRSIYLNTIFQPSFQSLAE